MQVTQTLACWKHAWQYMVDRPSASCPALYVGSGYWPSSALSWESSASVWPLCSLLCHTGNIESWNLLDGWDLSQVMHFFNNIFCCCLLFERLSQKFCADGRRICCMLCFVNPGFLRIISVFAHLLSFTIWFYRCYFFLKLEAFDES